MSFGEKLLSLFTFELLFPLNLACQNNVITSVKEIDYVVCKALRYYKQRSINPVCTIVFTLVCVFSFLSASS